MACGKPREVMRLRKPHDFMGAAGAHFIMARGSALTNDAG
ncbi:hypothetical protein LMG27174_07324 [Paraburkholderia rhynchosiae]|uniref:Uncharacterized protein n=1 Tax=Paraburkholderia rhynchosiae TaxID=487049 RepID=A0A6J5CYG1_9BURK|nr:hypothetical protein LMG27174_07324 [Paraburkholderia rhynchosiae]